MLRFSYHTQDRTYQLNGHVFGLLMYQSDFRHWSLEPESPWKMKVYLDKLISSAFSFNNMLKQVLILTGCCISCLAINDGLCSLLIWIFFVKTLTTFSHVKSRTVSRLFGVCQKRVAFVSGHKITGYPAPVDMDVYHRGLTRKRNMRKRVLSASLRQWPTELHRELNEA